jgi:hypothetical protein
METVPDVPELPEDPPPSPPPQPASRATMAKASPKRMLRFFISRILLLLKCTSLPQMISFMASLCQESGTWHFQLNTQKDIPIAKSMPSGRENIFNNIDVLEKGRPTRAIDNPTIVY